MLWSFIAESLLCLCVSLNVACPVIWEACGNSGALQQVCHRISSISSTISSTAFSSQMPSRCPKAITSPPHPSHLSIPSIGFYALVSLSANTNGTYQIGKKYSQKYFAIGKSFNQESLSCRPNLISKSHQSSLNVFSPLHDAEKIALTHCVSEANWSEK